jgi:hypothetical protein
MKALPARPPTAPQLDDDLFVPDDLVGRLYRAGDSPIIELLAGMSSDSRANLAMFLLPQSAFASHRLGDCRDLRVVVLAAGMGSGARARHLRPIGPARRRQRGRRAPADDHARAIGRFGAGRRLRRTDMIAG